MLLHSKIGSIFIVKPHNLSPDGQTDGHCGNHFKLGHFVQINISSTLLAHLQSVYGLAYIRVSVFHVTRKL